MMSDDSQFGGSTGKPGTPAGNDYGFFAASPAPPVAAPGQFGSPPGAAQQPPPAPGQFGPPPPAPFGTPAPFGAPPAFGAPAFGQAPYPAPRRRGLPVWAIVAISVPAALVVLGILAAVAIPVFLNQRDKATVAATSVSMPTQINAMSTSTNAALRAQVQNLFSSIPGCTCFDPPVSSILTDSSNTHAIIVGAAKVNTRFNADDRAEFVRSFWVSARGSAGAAIGEATNRDTGRLGGTMSCAPLAGGAIGQVCVAVDAGSFFFVVDTYRSGTVDPELPVAAREAIVHRT
jgi:type II secretory pathway pseudopilin PulG